MRPPRTLRLSLAAAGAIALASSGCGRSGISRSNDGAAGSDAPTSTGGVSGGSGGSGGVPISAGSRSGGTTGAGGSGGTASGGAGGIGGAATGAAGGTAVGGAGGVASGGTSVVRGSGGTISGGAGNVASGGAGGTRTGGSGGVGGTVTGGGSGSGFGGSGGTATGRTGGSGAGGSAGSGASKGGSIDTGGIPGSGGNGGVSTGGAGGAGTAGTGDSDGGTGAGDTYAGCRFLGDPSTNLAVTKANAQGMCVSLKLQSGGGTGTLGLSLPKTWAVLSAARWPSSTGPCTTSDPPDAASRASSGTGTVTFNGGITSDGLTVDLDTVLTFPAASGASESETLQAKAVGATSTCGYYACLSVAGGVSRVVVYRPYDQRLCVTLVLANSGGTDTSGLAVPSGWIVESAAQWPYSTAACTTTPAPAGAIPAIGATGRAGFIGVLGESSFTVSVNAALSFPPGDSGAGQSVSFQALLAGATASCK